MVNDRYFVQYSVSKAKNNKMWYTNMNNLNENFEIKDDPKFSFQKEWSSDKNSLIMIR